MNKAPSQDFVESESEATSAQDDDITVGALLPQDVSEIRPELDENVSLGSARVEEPNSEGTVPALAAVSRTMIEKEVSVCESHEFVDKGGNAVQDDAPGASKGVSGFASFAENTIDFDRSGLPLYSPSDRGIPSNEVADMSEGNIAGGALGEATNPTEGDARGELLTSTSSSPTALIEERNVQAGKNSGDCGEVPLGVVSSSAEDTHSPSTVPARSLYVDQTLEEVVVTTGLSSVNAVSLPLPASVQVSGVVASVSESVVSPALTPVATMSPGAVTREKGTDINISETSPFRGSSSVILSDLFPRSGTSSGVVFASMVEPPARVSIPEIVTSSEDPVSTRADLNLPSKEVLFAGVASIFLPYLYKLYDCRGHIFTQIAGQSQFVRVMNLQFLGVLLQSLDEKPLGDLTLEEINALCQGLNSVRFSHIDTRWLELDLQRARHSVQATRAQRELTRLQGEIDKTEKILKGLQADKAKLLDHVKAHEELGASTWDVRRSICKNLLG